MNTVEFKGDEIRLRRLEEFFNALMVKELERNLGQLPDFSKTDRGYLFNIEFEEGMLSYQTKWAPNTGVIAEIGEYFKLDFCHQYEEYGMGVFGEAIYENGILTVFELDGFDLERIMFDEASENYVFEGSAFEVIDEIVEIIIYRKKLAAGFIRNHNL